jgi:prepilin signal peptidase PulO-like enzyme (type II secretory pathway)
VIYAVFANCNIGSEWSGISMGNICWWKSHLGVGSLFFALFIYLIVVAVSVIDLEKQIIPDELVFLPYIVVLILLILIHPDNFYSFILSGFLASLFLLLLNFITRGRGMGLGDVKFVLMGGTLVGLPLMILWLAISFVLGAVTGLFLIAIKRAEFGKSISFGPYLAVALIITFLFGTDIIKLLGFL